MDKDLLTLGKGKIVLINRPAGLVKGVQPDIGGIPLEMVQEYDTELKLDVGMSVDYETVTTAAGDTFAVSVRRDDGSYREISGEISDITVALHSKGTIKYNLFGMWKVDFTQKYLTELNIQVATPITFIMIKVKGKKHAVALRKK